MAELIPSLLGLIAGLVLLTYSADRFVAWAEQIALKLGVSSLIIGITVVGFGTSAPEMLVSAVAAIQNRPGIAIGNAVGSNIANIGLILGFTALLAPIHSSRAVIRREFPLLMAVTLFGSIIMFNGTLSFWEGCLFLLVQVFILWTSIRLSKRHSIESHEQIDNATKEPTASPVAKIVESRLWMVLLKISLFFILLVGSSRLLVWSAVNIAEYFHISDLIIGLTIIAVGTSLPEFAASLAASRKGLSDMVLGNVLGSNIFNLLSVLGISAVIRPQNLDSAVISRDLPVMLGFTLLLGIFIFKRRGSGLINRTKGVILLACYAGYQVLLYLAVVNPTL